MVQQLVKDLVESVVPHVPLVVGKRYIYTPPGKRSRLVEITGGQYWGEHGLSNFWSWRYVKNNGLLSKKEYSGYDMGEFQLEQS